MADEPNADSESHPLVRAATSLGGVGGAVVAVGTIGSAAIVAGLAVGAAAGSIGSTVAAMPLWRIVALGCIGLVFFVLFVVFMVFAFTGLVVACRAAGDRLAAWIGSTGDEPEGDDPPEATDPDARLLAVSTLGQPISPPQPDPSHHHRG